MKFSEIRVARRGLHISRVGWIPKDDQFAPVDLTAMEVMKIENVMTPGSEPRVCVTFRARIVEVEE